MKSIQINGTSRKDLGKKSCKKLRTNAEVPCVLYGGGETIHFHALVKEFKDLIYTPHTFLVDLNIDGKAHKAVIKDQQYHPVTDDLLHLDFYQIDETKKLTVSVPVATHGFAKGVQAGGKLQLMAKKLKVCAYVKDLPDVLDIDVVDLGLGKTIKVQDLKYDNIELTDAKNAVVVAIKLTRAAKGAAGEAPAAK